MYKRNSRPKWGWLYPVLPVAALLLWVSQRSQASNAVHGWLAMGVAVLVIGYVGLWVEANRAALLHPEVGSAGPDSFYWAREALPARHGHAVAADQFLVVDDDFVPVSTGGSHATWDRE